MNLAPKGWPAFDKNPVQLPEWGFLLPVDTEKNQPS